MILRIPPHLIWCWLVIIINITIVWGINDNVNIIQPSYHQQFSLQKNQKINIQWKENNVIPQVFDVYIGLIDPSTANVVKGSLIAKHVVEQVTWHVTDGCNSITGMPCYEPSQQFWFVFVPVNATSEEIIPMWDKVSNIGFPIESPIIIGSIPTTSIPGLSLTYVVGKDKLPIEWIVRNVPNALTTIVTVILQLPSSAVHRTILGESIVLLDNGSLEGAVKFVFPPNLPAANGYSVIFQANVYTCPSTNRFNTQQSIPKNINSFPTEIPLDTTNCQIVEQLQTRSPLFGIRGPQLWISSIKSIKDNIEYDQIYNQAKLNVVVKTNEQFQYFVHNVQLYLLPAKTTNIFTAIQTKAAIFLSEISGETIEFGEFNVRLPLLVELENEYIIVAYSNNSANSQILHQTDSFRVLPFSIQLTVPPQLGLYNDEFELDVPIFHETIPVRWNFLAHQNASNIEVKFYIQPFDDSISQSVEISPMNVQISQGAYDLSIPAMVWKIVETHSEQQIEFELVMIVSTKGTENSSHTLSSIPFLLSKSSLVGEDQYPLAIFNEPIAFTSHVAGTVIDLSVQLVNEEFDAASSFQLQLFDAKTKVGAICGVEQCPETIIGGFSKLKNKKIKWSIPTNLMHTDSTFLVRIIDISYEPHRIFASSAPFTIVSTHGNVVPIQPKGKDAYYAIGDTIEVASKVSEAFGIELSIADSGVPLKKYNANRQNVFNFTIPCDMPANFYEMNVVHSNGVIHSIAKARIAKPGLTFVSPVQSSTYSLKEAFPIKWSSVSDVPLHIRENCRDIFPNHISIEIESTSNKRRYTLAPSVENNGYATLFFPENVDEGEYVVILSNQQQKSIAKSQVFNVAAILDIESPKVHTNTRVEYGTIALNKHSGIESIEIDISESVNDTLKPNKKTMANEGHVHVVKYNSIAFVIPAILLCILILVVCIITKAPPQDLDQYRRLHEASKQPQEVEPLRKKLLVHSKSSSGSLSELVTRENCPENQVVNDIVSDGEINQYLGEVRTLLKESSNWSE